MVGATYGRGLIYQAPHLSGLMNQTPTFYSCDFFTPPMDLCYNRTWTKKTWTQKIWTKKTLRLC